MAAVDPFEEKPRRWYVIVAAVALLSLFVLALFVPTEESIARKDAAEMEAIEDHLVTGDFESAERRARIFLRKRGGSDHAGKAQFLLAKSILARAKAGPFPGRALIDHAWDLLDTGARFHPPPGEDVARFQAEVFAAQREAARVLRQEGHFDRAIQYLESLKDQPGEVDRAIFFDLSRVYAEQARKQRHRFQDLMDLSMTKLDDYLRLTTDPAGQVRGLTEKARLYWERGDFAEMRALLVDTLGRFPETPLRPRLQLELGKALSRLGQPGEAVAVLRKAAADLEYPARDLALLHLVHLHFLLSDPECHRLADQLIRRGSEYRPQARLILGLYYLETGRALPYRELLLGLEDMESPEILERERFDVNGIYGRIRKVWERGADGETLELLARIVAEFRRLYPDRLQHTMDAALVGRLAGDYFHERGLAREAVGDHDAADRLHLRAADLYYLSGETYVEASRRRDTPPDICSDAYRRAGEAFFAGGWFVKAARQFYEFYAFRPVQNHEGLYWEGISYSRAGIFLVDGKGRAAVRTLSEYVRISPPGSILVPRALLERGRIYLRLGDHTSAATDFERVVSQPGLGIGPKTPEWAEGKRLKGVAQLSRALALKPEIQDPDKQSQYVTALRGAEVEFREYIERYVEEQAPTPSGIQATFDLARVHLAGEEWDRARDQLDEVRRLARRIPGTLGEEAEESVRQAHFLLGETLLALGLDEEAMAAFETAYNRYVTRPERIWGLLGQALAAVRLDRSQTAKSKLRQARDLLERNRPTYEASLAGFGATYWPDYLATVEREIERAETLKGESRR